MIKRRDLVVLCLGLAIGAGVASLYWRGSERQGQLAFNHNLKCQQIARQFESENSTIATIVKSAYSPSRNSCIAEVIWIVPPESDNVRYTVEDLLSHEAFFIKSVKRGEPIGQTAKEQEAQFITASR